jgi:hypothetical protein
VSCREEADLSEPRDQKELTDLVNRLFMYTDDRNWQGLQTEVFTPSLHFDMVSAGAGPARTVTSRDVTDMWSAGFQRVDAVHHQAGHYIITVNGNGAEIYAYSVATHYRQAATRGHTRTMVGSYDLGAQRTPGGWRLDSFRYNLKYMEGNLTLE